MTAKTTAVGPRRRESAIAVVAVVTALAIVFLLRWWMVESQPVEVTAPVGAPSESARPEHSQMIDAAAAERTPVAQDRSARITVRAEDGTPVPGAEILPFGAGSLTISAANRQACIGLTDASGVFAVTAADIDRVAEGAAVLAVGFGPAVLGPIEIGHFYDVVVRAAANLRFVAQDTTGAPVAGFSAGVAIGRPAMDVLELCRDRGSKVTLAMDGQFLSGRTNRDGVLDLAVPRGQYTPWLSFADDHFVVVNARETPLVSAPGEYRVTVGRPLACVYRFPDGDPVSVRFLPGSGLRPARSRDSCTVCANVSEHLRRLFSGSHVVCMLPENGNGAAPATGTVAFLTRDGRLLTQAVTMRPCDQIDSPVDIKVTGGTATPGYLTAVATNPNGEVLDLEQGELMIVADYPGGRCTFDIPAGQEVLVPSGAIDVTPSHVTSLAQITKPVSVVLLPGQRLTVPVVMRQTVRRGTITFQRPDGKRPLGGSVSYATSLGRRNRMLGNGAEVTGWFVGDSIDYKCSFVGHSSSGRLSIDETKGANVVQRWTVEVQGGQ